MPTSPLIDAARRTMIGSPIRPQPVAAQPISSSDNPSSASTTMIVKTNTNLQANHIVGPTTTLYSYGEKLREKRNTISMYESQIERRLISVKHTNKKLEDEYDSYYMEETDKLRASSTVTETEYTAKRNGIIADLDNQIKNIKERGAQYVQTTIQSYIDEYNAHSAEIDKAVKIVNHLIGEFNIENKSTYNLIVSKEQAMQLEPQKIIDLAVNDVNTLNTLSSESNWKEGKTINKILELEKTKNKILAGSVIGVGLLTAPLICGAGSVNILKSLSSTYNIIRQKDKLREEILRLSKALQIQKLEHRKSYKLPTPQEEVNADIERLVKDLKQTTKESIQQLDDTFKEFKNNYNKQRMQLQERLDIKKEEMEASKQSNFDTFNQGKVDLEKQIETLEADYIAFLDEVQGKHRALVEYEDRYNEDLNTLISYLKIKQLLQDCITISEFDLAMEVDEEAPENVRKMQAYDLELRSELLTLKQQIEPHLLAGESYNDALARYKNMIFEQQRMMDKYYVASLSGKILGEAVKSEENKELLQMKEYAQSICGYGSTLCICRNSDDEEVIVDFIKYLVQQTLYKAEPLACRVNIIDRSMSLVYKEIQYKLYNKKDKTYTNIVDVKTKDDEITKYAEALESQISLMARDDIVDCNFEEYTMNMRSKGAKTPTSYINILHREALSSPFMRFTESSNETGIINIFIVYFDDIFKVNEDKTYSLKDNLQRTLNKFTNILEVESIVNGGARMAITKKDTTQEFVYFKRTKKEIINYKKKLQARYNPDLATFTLTSEFIEKVVEGLGGNYWSLTPEDGIRLFFGPIKGDMSNILPVILDEDDKPHMFLGGTTGGGKSNTLAVMVNTLKMTYAPSALQVVYFDFKVVEVGMHIAPYKMPHCIAMCGTECAEYLNSLFKFVVGSMDYRYNLFNQMGTVNLLGARKKIKAEKEALIEKGLQEEADAIEQLPAMLIIIDEAAQGAQHEDQTVVDTYVASLMVLGQKARAAGIHMLLTSQDPDKMPQNLMPLISTRGCTKASRAVSQSVINNPVCSLPENQYKGFFATNNSLAGEMEKNQIYVVPWNQEKETKRFTKIAYEYAIKHDIFYDAVVFDENDLYTKQKLDLYISENPTFVRNTRLPLGEGCFFRRVFKPFFIDFKCDDSENLLIASSNLPRKINMYRSFIDAFRGRAKLIPGFSKGIPEYVKLEDFYDDDSPYEMCHYDKFFYFAGKGMFKANSPEVEDGLVRQLYWGDIYNKPDYNGNPNDYSDDELEEMDYNDPSLETESFLEAIEDEVKYYKDKGSDPMIPIFFVIFDFDKHPYMVAKEFDFSKFKSVANEASSHNIHLVFISTTASVFMEKMVFGHCLLSKLGSDPNLDRKYTKIPKRMCMYASEKDSTLNCYYKMTIYEPEPDEGTEVEEEEEVGGYIDANTVNEFENTPLPDSDNEDDNYDEEDLDDYTNSESEY